MRTFLAIYPDEHARAAVAEVAPEDDEEVRATEMAEWHVTLRFLGELDEPRTCAAASAARELARHTAPFTVQLGPATAIGFGGQVLFVPVRGTEDLAEALDRALAADFGDRDRAYRAHLTIARSRGRRRLGRWRAGMPVRASFRVEELALVGSTLGPDRAEHRILERFGLGAPST